MPGNKKEIDINELTLCTSTAKTLQPMRCDGVENAFGRAWDMTPCPSGAKSACCKHFAIKPCRRGDRIADLPVGMAARRALNQRQKVSGP